MHNKKKNYKRYNMSKIIHDIFNSIKHYSSKESFYIQEHSYSYSQLEIYISKTLSVIDNNKKQKCIGIIEGDDIETYAAILAVLFSGNTYVILNPHNPNARNEKIIESTEIELILSKGDNNLYKYLSDRHNCIITSSIESKVNIEIRNIRSEDIAYIIFTSGSTGVPISYGNLDAFYTDYSSLGFKLDCNDKMLQMFDLCFDVSVVSTLYPLSIGASIYTVPMDAVKYTYVYELLEDHELTFAAIPPSILNLLRPYFSEIELAKLKYIILTAEASHFDVVNEFLPSIPNGQIVNLYGPSEGTIYCSSYFIQTGNIKNYNGMLSIGKIFNNMKALILNTDNKEVDRGEKGELCIHGNQIMSAYWNDKEKTDEAFINISGNNYYRTGDICYIDNENDILYCGRKDHQVQINGFRVELSEIEHYAKQLNPDGNNVVIPYKNTNGTLSLHLIVENYQGDNSELLNLIKENVPTYMCPRSIHNIDSFPLNTSGKIDRKELEKIIK